ncbi:LemA family protein [Shewanella gelidii]|uniref:LemA protein n=1 Tax=Shewanella gelidii TaxID=1642821 RepID=A0A917JQJ4_9GAMM|nr:LemA family protein [Shewanella gelidii]MCL1099127.1 LemA family protein [Shewanella gelidii]GGI81517.1 LemA protein [Shewanella gelidii]
MEGLLLILGLALIIAYLWYVSLVKKRNACREALSGIDVQLTKRANLVPNILKIAQKFMEHEKVLLTEITELRTQVVKQYSLSDRQAVEGHLAAAEQLNEKMSQLMLNVENYPELKSDHTMLQAMQTYNEVEAHISAARRFYNAAVTELNNAVEIFPGSLIANIASIVTMPFYKAAETAQTPIDAADFLK